MKDPTWDALFVVTYQSTDETDDAEGIDPETDGEEVAMSVPLCSFATVDNTSLSKPDLHKSNPRTSDIV
jgi:hypothetical protein